MSEYREIDRFEVETETGERLTLVVVQTIIVSRTHSGISKTPGLKTLQTLSGRAVISNADGSFTVNGVRAVRPGAAQI